MMRFQWFAAVLATGLLLVGASGTMAQLVIDGIEVTTEDLPRLQAYCRSLAVERTRSLTSDATAGMTEPSSDPASSWSIGANSMNNALSHFDLNRLTYKKCREADLL